MDHFNAALADVLKHEGGYVDHKADLGGATHFGISLRFIKQLPAFAGDINGDGHINVLDIQQLSKADAAQIYRQYFWLHYRLEQVQSEKIAIKLLNLFVNMRGKTATLIVQRAVNDLLTESHLVEDGILGSQSLAKLNQQTEDALYACLQYQAWQVYRAIVEHNPSQSVFLNGWQRRAFS
ncbi:glycoside hydrolase family 108 protein [Marinomonas aquiplantarum]|uniref:Putative peptidoglycan binding protein n=1 Tax=Marinomonas aquiplantarum TaxID=491951 RepID=A0A366D7A7_9GAMM|nr:glycosyl hydrolase 108 family protein [Marinomonas aquiplantarum]RBO85913.1 putative peptidoglycan binding protein [Marinomonas aquiplantarum]